MGVVIHEMEERGKATNAGSFAPIIMTCKDLTVVESLLVYRSYLTLV